MNSMAVVAGGDDKACQKNGDCGCRGGKSAGYLASLVLVAWGIQIPMLLFAVPKFVERLSEYGVQLPEFSRLVINWSHWMATEQFATKLTGAIVYGAAIVGLSLGAFALAKLGGRFGKALVVLLALLGGLIACGQAAAVIVPAMQTKAAADAAQP